MRALTILLSAILISSQLLAQGDVSSDIITGRVIAPDGRALEGAQVSVISLVTNTSRTARTDEDGRFTLLFRDGGGGYRLVVTSLGLRPVDVTVQGRPGEDRLDVVIRMTNVQELAAVEVRATALPTLEEAYRAGGNERTLSAELLQRMPVNPGDLFGSALLIPGIIGTAATDTSRGAFSVAATTPTQNNVTVDGMTFLFGSIPQEAVRSTRVIINAYDVSRGQFTGAQLATDTKSGSSDFQAHATFAGLPRVTQLGAGGQDAFTQKYSRGLVSVGLGGPFIGTNRAFYHFSGEVESRSDDALSLETAFEPTLTKMGVALDSIQRLRRALTVLGVPLSPAVPLERGVTIGSALGRVDIDISQTNQLMLRGDFRARKDEGNRVLPYGFPNTGGATSGVGGGAMATWTAVTAGGRVVNHARVYASWQREESEPHLRMPAGVVAVRSAMNEGQQLALLHFGGNAGLPRSSRQTLQEANNEITYLADSGRHRIKLGALVNRERAEIRGALNRYGTFYYASLSDLENNTPATFSRTIAGDGYLIGTDNVALYISHAWQKTPSLLMTYGGRFEMSRLADSPEANQLVEAAFRKQTRSFLGEVAGLPRFGLSYLIHNDSGPRGGRLSIGVGEFRGRIPPHLMQYVHTNAAFANSDSQVVCVGPVVPAADWATVVADSLRIPRDCISGVTNLPLGQTATNLALWGKDAGAPRVWRSALSLSKQMFGLYRLDIDALYARGERNPAAIDLNFARKSFMTSAKAGNPTAVVRVDAPPEFTLADEPRPVYAPAAAFVESTGAVSTSASRLFPFFGTAYEIGSGIRSRTAQITVRFSGNGNALGVRPLSAFDIGYTFMHARDQSNGFPFSDSYPTTAGDPRTTEWGPSDRERRHSVLGMAVVGLTHALELGVLVRLTSGQRFTPMVNGDVNGDGLHNDRAFIFANTMDSPAAAGIQRLIANADSRASECLSRQLGRIASRNSCTTPWQPSVDFQLNWQPPGMRERQLTVSVMALNVLAGVDRLLHGPNMKGWGQPAFVDARLLNVTGFDSATRAFDYTVNEHFGNQSGAAAPLRLPFQLGLQLRMQLGRPSVARARGTPTSRP